MIPNNPCPKRKNDPANFPGQHASETTQKRYQEWESQANNDG